MQIREKICAIFPELNSVKNREWVDSACNIWQELFEICKWDSLEAVPFGIKSPEISLIKHTKAVLQNALHIASTMKLIHEYEQPIDFDVLIITCILHDVDKLLVTEPDENKNINLTDIGLDYQHGFYSAFYATTHGLPSSIVTLLIDHTPFSTLAPNSIEGIILILADICDAELISFVKGGQSSLMSALGKTSNRQLAKKLFVKNNKE